MKWKTAAGIALMVLSIAAMYVWESFGREALTMTEAVCAARDISEGDAVTAGAFRTLRLPRGAVLRAGLSSSAISLAAGMTAARDIAENQQIALSDLRDPEEAFADGASQYVIPQRWIFSRSSSIAEGDDVYIYAMPGAEPVGVFRTMRCAEDAVEIACMLEDYVGICEAAKGETFEGLLIVKAQRKGEEKRI